MTSHDAALVPPVATQTSRPTGPLGLILDAVVIVVLICSVGLVVNQLWSLGLFGVRILEKTFLCVLAAFLLPLVFLLFGATKTSRRDGLPSLLDLALAALGVAAACYIAWNSERSTMEGWEYLAPDQAKWVSALFCVIVLEALRRVGGLVITVIAALMMIYPAVASVMPAPFTGLSQPLGSVFAYHVFSELSLFGIPMQAFALLVFGFLLFGVTLNKTGGGIFFNDLAFSLVGDKRGGAAQVGAVASMLQGSISGSVLSNVISSGVVTIPAMKRTGFSARYAGAVESVASTGGVLMPPIMGSTAFVMASFLNLPYVEIVQAAIVPGILFYLAIVLQIWAYSGRRGLHGLPKDELPRSLEVLKTGWIYLVVFAGLIWMLIVWQIEARAPFYATAALLVVNQLNPKTRMSLGQFRDYLVSAGRTLAEIMGILLGIGFVVGGLTVTGLSGTLVNSLVFLIGDGIVPLLFMGAITSFVFGMGMTVTACYIFLAIVLAPPLIRLGLEPMAVHLFIMYWGMVSFITPPVALAAFGAASISGANPMAVGFEAMRLGFAIYIIPFLFVLNPALIFIGTTPEIMTALAAAFVGIALIAYAAQGFFPLIGTVAVTPLGLAGRLLTAVGAFLIAERSFAFFFDLPFGHVIEWAILASGLCLVWAARSQTVKKELAA